MPRWTSVIALFLCALVGGGVEAWAAPEAAVGVHDTAPPATSDVPSAEAEAEEEEADRTEPDAPAEVAGPEAAAHPTAEAESPDGVPSTPPPRR